MKVTEVVKKECKCGKTGYVKLVDNKVVFDSSNEQCHPMEVDIHILENIVKKHKEDMEHNSYVKSIKRYKKENEV